LLDSPPDANRKAVHWGIFHDVWVDAEDLLLIRQQAEKLCKLSETITAWNQSQYSDILRIVNGDSLQALRHCWQQYIAVSQWDQTNNDKFKDSIQASVKDCSWNTTNELSRSYGALANKASSLATKLSYFHWNSHVNNPEGRRHANPLYAYSVTSNNQFTVKPPSSPFTRFHLAGAIVPLASDSVYRSALKDAAIGSEAQIENSALIAGAQFHNSDSEMDGGNEKRSPTYNLKYKMKLKISCNKA
jgi:hypothetical protein